VPERRAGAHTASAGSESGTSGQWTTGRHDVKRLRKEAGSEFGSSRGTGWGKPQGGGIPGEPGRRLRRGNPVADVPTGWRMKPLKRDRRGIKPRRGCCNRTIDDPGHCRYGRNAAPTGGCDAGRKARGRPLPEEMCAGGNPGSPGNVSSPFSRSQEGRHRREAGDSSQVKLCRANPVSAPG